ncbi:MAG: uroporphyrinogen-III C-methyltransferase, partial [Acidobacteriota bacterium]
GSRRVAVGKRRGSSNISQIEIQTLLVQDARAGLAVVRLKGGDPFVFGRGGEEVLALLEHHVPFEVVPGVSSGIAIPALAGIPLTHRGIASSATFVTAHDLTSRARGRNARRRLMHLARGSDTLVLFMAGAESRQVGQTLLQAGLAKETPTAFIENGTLPEEALCLTTLGSLAKGTRVPATRPVLLVIGWTVALANQIRRGSLARAWLGGKSGARGAPQLATLSRGKRRVG